MIFKYASKLMCVDNKQQLLIYCWLNSAILITYCDLICKGVLLCCPTVKLRFQYEGSFISVDFKHA